MIKLNQDSTNTAIFTLCDREILTASTKYYLFNFINDDRQDDYYFVGDETTASTCNYDQFNITLTGITDVNLTASTINLTQGYYKYKVYEQLSPTNLSLSGTSGVILEQGKVLVCGDDIPTKTYYSGNTNSDLVFYEPDY